MGFNNALKGFKHLSESILADGKIDVNEAKLLKEFIYPYVLNGNKRFIEFDKLIDQCLEDKQITKDESVKLIELIDEILKFLKIDNWVYIGILTFIFISIISMTVVGICL